MKKLYLSLSLILASLCGACSSIPSSSLGNSSSSEEKPTINPADTYVDLVEAEPDFDSYFFEDYDSTSTVETETGTAFSDSAKWIWNSNTTVKNSWVRFRKSFNLKSKPSSAIARIGAASKYYAYVNGTLVVYEGSLKRGANVNDGYYDIVDLTDYLVEGDNVICILVWYWGAKNASYSNVPCSKGGLIFESQIGDQLVVSDSSWKAMRDNAYNSSASSGEAQPNYRLPEYNISYNANNLVDADWYTKSFSDANWSNAVVVGRYGDAPWNKLYKRTIPLNKNYGITAYNNFDEKLINYKTTQNEIIVMRVGVNVQLSPVFTIDSPAGKVIRIYTEATDDSQGNSVSCYYTTTEGEQTFECLGHINGQFVLYQIPSGVTIKFLGYRQTGYDTTKVGSFDSNSKFYNRLWQMSYDTLYVTMRDNFMDCPNRERAQWMGDVTNEMEQIIYSMDSNSYLLYEKALRQMIGFTTSEGVLPTVAPINNSWFELPVQNLCTISGAWTYYLYTGRKGIIEEVYPAFLRYVKLWRIGGTGLVSHRSGSWDWMDNDAETTIVDKTGIENSWYCKALLALSNMALLLDDDEGYEYATERYSMIADAFKANHLDELLTISDTKGDDRAISIAVLAGLVPESRYEEASDLLRRRQQCSPFWEKYVYDALCEMGEIEYALDRMKYRYNDMVMYREYSEQYSTLWEKWNTSGGTRNHAWSGGPMTTLSKYVLGVQPLTSNYGNVLVKPYISSMNVMSGTVPTLKGDIDVSYKYENSILDMSVSTPETMQVMLAIPFENGQDLTINNQIICTNGYIVENSDYLYVGSDSDYIYLFTDGGDYTINVM